MEHSYFKDKISAFKDQSLPADETQLISEHLDSCDECLQYLNKLNALDQLVKRESNLGEDEYWGQLSGKIDERIASLPDAEERGITDVSSRSSFFGIGWKLAATAASVAFLIFIGIHQSDILDQEQGEPDKSPIIRNVPRAIESSRIDSILEEEDKTDGFVSTEVQSASAPKENVEQNLEPGDNKTDLSGSFNFGSSVIRDTQESIKPVLEIDEKQEKGQSLDGRTGRVDRITSSDFSKLKKTALYNKVVSDSQNKVDLTDIEIESDNENYKLRLNKPVAGLRDIIQLTTDSNGSLDSSALFFRQNNPPIPQAVKDDETGIDDWRMERDELLESMPQYDPRENDMMELIGTSTKSKRVERSVIDDTAIVHEQRLFELTQKIIRDTSDSLEIEQSRSIIERLANYSSSGTIRRRARTILDSLGSGE